MTAQRWWVRHRALLSVLVPTIGAALADSWHLARESMTGTEVFTYWAAGRSPHVLDHVLHHVDIVHGFYYACVHVLFTVLGKSVLVMRLPSLVGAVAAVAATGVVARRVTGSNRAAFLCSAVLATIPALAGYAQIGRSYAVITGLVACLTYLLLRALDDPRRNRYWVAYTAVATLTIYLHEFAVLALVAHGVTVLWTCGGRRVVLTWFAYATAAVILAAPLILYSTTQSGQVAYLSRTRWSDVTGLALDYFGPVVAVAWTTAALAAIAVGSDLRRRLTGLSITSVGLPLLVLPGGLLLVESAITTPYFSGDRYVLFGTVGAALLIGRGADRVLDAAARRISGGTVTAGRLVAVAMIVGLFLAQLPQQRMLRSTRNDPEYFLGVAQYLQRHACKDDGVFFEPRNLSAIRLGYPGYLHTLDDVEQIVGPERSGTLYGIDYPRSSTLTRALTRNRLWLLTRVEDQYNADVMEYLHIHGYAASERQMYGDLDIVLMRRSSGWLTHGGHAQLPRCVPA